MFSYFGISIGNTNPLLPKPCDPFLPFTELLFFFCVNSELSYMGVLYPLFLPWPSLDDLDVLIILRVIFGFMC